MLTPLVWRWRHVRRILRERPHWAGILGWPSYLRFGLTPLFGPLAGDGVRTLRLRGYRHPLYYRTGSSDPHVILQVFARDEYVCVGSEPDIRFILDCGANTGCTTFYLLHRYPEARAVVVEPDAGNMAMCRRNLAPFGDRVTFIQAGVWSVAAPMVVERGAFRDGGEWAFQVRPARSGETADFTAVTMEQLVTDAGFPRVDILKMDIEAAESEVFGPEADRWLSLVRTLVIELHGPDCERAVTTTASQFPHTTSRSGELTVFRFERAVSSCS